MEAPLDCYMLCLSSVEILRQGPNTGRAPLLLGGNMFCSRMLPRSVPRLLLWVFAFQWGVSARSLVPYGCTRYRWLSSGAGCGWQLIWGGAVSASAVTAM